MNLIKFTIPIMPQRPLHRRTRELRDKLLQDMRQELTKPGETQESLAGKSETTKETVSRILSGKRGANLSLDIAIKIWDALGVLEERIGCQISRDIAQKVKKLQHDDMDILMEFLDLLNYKDVTPKNLLSALKQTIHGLHEETVKKIAAESAIGITAKNMFISDKQIINSGTINFASLRSRSKKP